MFLAEVLHLCVHGGVVSHCVGEVCHVVVANGIQGLIFIVYEAIGYRQERLLTGRIDGGNSMELLATGRSGFRWVKLMAEMADNESVGLRRCLARL